IIVIVLRTRLDAFVALLLAALVTGFVAGSPASDTLDSIITGFGETMAAIGIVIGLGVAVGKILEVSGAADALARAFVRALGKGREPWAMAGTGSLVSIPVFCDSGYVIMNPLARSIARTKQAGYVTLALALGAGMTLTHHLVPPTPGPLAVAGLIGADLGGLILAGLVFALLLMPIVVAYARWIGPRLEDHVAPDVREAVYGTAQARSSVAVGDHGGGSGTDAETPPEADRPRRMSPLIAALPLLVPLLLILANTVALATALPDAGPRDVVVLATVVDDTDVVDIGPDDAERLPHELARVVRRTLGHQRVDGLLTELAADGLTVEEELVPLAVAGSFVGGPWEGLPLVTKGGLVGDADTMIACVAHLRRAAEAARRQVSAANATTSHQEDQA
ncbi:MAG: hypothetical protein GEU97_11980, partial [Actinophytocola sp.]|nr:hypothetical protein [Actinophytocola sp.]